MNRRNFLRLIGTGMLFAAMPSKLIAEPRPKTEKSFDIADIQLPDFEVIEEEKVEIVEKTETTPTPEQGIPSFEFDNPSGDERVKIPDFNQSYDRPFGYVESNNIAERLNIKLPDLYNPDIDTIRNLKEIENSMEILPIYEPEVEKWGSLVQEICFEYNQDNPNNPVSPNIILSLMSIESNGNPNAVSSANALGLMQLTSDVYASGFFGIYSAKQMFDPETNIKLAISYLGDIMKKAKKLGLEGAEAWQYVSMEYNGGQRNASRYFKTKQATNLHGETNEIFEVDNYQKVLDYLKRFKGNTSGSFEYGTNMVKRETLLYREKFARFQVIAEVAANLKREGFSDIDVKQLLASSDILKSTAAEIYRRKEKVKNTKGYATYFDIKYIIDELSDENFDYENLPKIDKPEGRNPANLFLANVVYS